MDVAEIWKDWRKTVFLGFGILILGLVLRLVNLNILPVFGDEAIYIRWSQVMNAEPGLRFLPLSDGKQPLFMWGLMFLVTRFSDPLFIGRLVSVATGMGTLVGVFALSYYLFRSKMVSLIASLFWAISPYSLFYDRLALVDSMLAMFGVWTLFFAVVTAKTKRLDFAMLTGFALGGALLTKSPGQFFVIMLPLTWMVSNWPSRKRGVRAESQELVHLIKLVSLLLVAIIIAYALYNILRLGENFHLITLRNKDYIYPISHIWQNPFDPLIPHLKDVYDWFWLLGPGLILVFVILSVFLKFDIRNIRKNRPNPEMVLIFLWSTVPILVTAMYAKAFTARYIFFTVPTIFIFASLAFFSLKDKGGMFKKILFLGLGLYVLLALRVDYFLLTQPEKATLPHILRSGYLEEWTSGTGIKEVSEFIIEEYRQEPDKKIVVGTEGYFGTLPDGLQMYLNNYPEITVIGVGIDIKELPTSLLESKQTGNKTYLVINDSRLKADPAQIELKLLASYPKELRKKETSEYNLHGPQDYLYLFEL